MQFSERSRNPNLSTARQERPVLLDKLPSTIILLCCCQLLQQRVSFCAQELRVRFQQALRLHPAFCLNEGDQMLEQGLLAINSRQFGERLPIHCVLPEQRKRRFAQLGT